MNGNSVALDTNIVLYLLNGDQVLSELLYQKKLYLSFISQLELLSFRGITQKEYNQINKFIQDCIVIDARSSGVAARGVQAQMGLGRASDGGFGAELSRQKGAQADHIQRDSRSGLRASLVLVGKGFDRARRRDECCLSFDRKLELPDFDRCIEPNDSRRGVRQAIDSERPPAQGLLLHSAPDLPTNVRPLL